MNLPPHVTSLAEMALETLMGQVRGALSAVLSTVDGFDVASRSDSAVQGSRLAAMASSIAAICMVVGEESQLGEHQSISIEAEKGYVVMVHVTHPANSMILCLVADKSAVLAQMIYFAKQTAAQLSEASA